jgi:hypothetical protein
MRRLQSPKRYRRELQGYESGQALSRAVAAAKANPLQDRIAAILAVMLAADEIDSDAIVWLACREHYPDAADALAQICSSGGLVKALFAPASPAVQPLRIATALRVVKMGSVLISADKLRRFAADSKHKGRAARAALALAALGAPIAPFAELPRRQKAAVILRELIQLFKARAS